MSMTFMPYAFSRIAVKVGSNVLTRPDGTLDFTRMSALTDQLAALHRAGTEVILISSGAVACGRSEMHLPQTETEEMDSVEQRQLYSAVGQAKLMGRYVELFRDHGIHIGQVLTEKENFSTPTQRDNMYRCIMAMLRHGVMPVVNENDTVCITELMFTDNDELSGLMACLVHCEALIILSNVDGLYNGSPADPRSVVIPEIHSAEEALQYVRPERSGMGRGGMQSKCATALAVADSGVHVFLANGKREGVLTDLLLHPDRIPFTHFLPHDF